MNHDNSSSLDLDHVSHNSAYGSHERNLKSHLPPSISHEIFFHSSLLLYPFFLSFLVYLYPFIHSFIHSFFLSFSFFLILSISIHSFLLAVSMSFIASGKKRKNITLHHIIPLSLSQTYPLIATRISQDASLAKNSWALYPAFTGAKDCPLLLHRPQSPLHSLS